MLNLSLLNLGSKFIHLGYSFQECLKTMTLQLEDAIERASPALLDKKKNTSDKDQRLHPVVLNLNLSKQEG